jgi:hypothetical protein
VPRAAEHQRICVHRLNQPRINMTSPFPCRQTRREFVWDMGAVLPGSALTGLLSRDGFFRTDWLRLRSAHSINPLAPKPSHSFGRAKSVIFLMNERRTEPGRHVRP